MNKTDLISRVAQDASLTKQEAEAAVNQTFRAIEEALAAREKVQILGFGTFETRTRAARTGRNPQTGAEVQIPESTVPAFKAGNVLKEKVK